MRRAGDPDEKPLQALGASGENTLRYDDARRGCAFSKVTLSGLKAGSILTLTSITIRFDSWTPLDLRPYHLVEGCRFNMVVPVVR